MEAKTIKRIDVSSFALTLAVIHAIMAFFAGVALAVLSAVISPDMIFLFGFFAILYPILGFIGGFIAGAIYAFIYNFLSGRYESVRFKGEL